MDKKGKTIVINEVEYSIDNVALAEEIKRADQRFIDNKMSYGDFWSDLEEKVHISRGAVRGWEAGRMPTKTKDKFLNVLEHLEIDRKLILIPVSTEKTSDCYGNLKRKVEIERELLKELGISASVLLTYLGFFKGYNISYITVLKIVKGKLVPTEDLINDIDVLLAEVKMNRQCEPIQAVAQGTYSQTQLLALNGRCALYRKCMNQFGISLNSIFQYLRIIKNYDVDYLTMLKIIRGFIPPTEELVRDVDEFITNVETSILDFDFPMSIDQFESIDPKSAISNEVKFGKVIGIVFSNEYGLEGILDRIKQARRMESFCKNNGISILVYQFHYVRDSSIIDLKHAITRVESGEYDALMLFGEEIFISELTKSIVLAYCKMHGIPVVILKNSFYK